MVKLSSIFSSRSLLQEHLPETALHAFKYVWPFLAFNCCGENICFNWMSVSHTLCLSPWSTSAPRPSPQHGDAHLESAIEKRVTILKAAHMRPVQRKGQSKAAPPYLCEASVKRLTSISLGGGRWSLQRHEVLQRLYSVPPNRNQL